MTMAAGGQLSKEGVLGRTTDNGIASFTPRTYADPHGVLMPEDVIIEVRFRDKTVFYIDDGLLGGDAHIFFRADIPSHYRLGRGWGVWGAIGDAVDESLFILSGCRR